MTPKQRKQRFLPLWIVGFSVVSLALFVGVPFVFAFRDANVTDTCHAGTCNQGIPTFLNSSGADQKKTGNLTIGPIPPVNGTQACDTRDAAKTANCSRLCLNPNNNSFSEYPITTDPDNCVISWDDVVQKIKITSGYVHALPAENSNILDYGAVALVSHGTDANSQLMSLITTATGASPAALQTNSVTGASYAATFGGRFVVDRRPDGAPGSICLNGSSATSCLSSWSQIVKQQDSAIVQLRLVDHKTVEPDIGRTSTTGVLVAGDYYDLKSNFEHSGGLIIGLPPVAEYCGDGICTTHETEGICTIDCLP